MRVQDPRVQNEGSWNSYVDYKIFLHVSASHLYTGINTPPGGGTVLAQNLSVDVLDRPKTEEKEERSESLGVLQSCLQAGSTLLWVQPLSRTVACGLDPR